jgi:hypothetical protein
MSDAVVKQLPPNVFAQTYSFAKQIPIEKLPKIAPLLQSVVRELVFGLNGRMQRFGAF